MSTVYLGTDMERYKYTKMVPRHAIGQYEMDKHKQNGNVYLRFRKAIYGRPAAEALANTQL